jgi:hypothetical protein
MRIVGGRCKLDAPVLAAEGSSSECVVSDEGDLRELAWQQHTTTRASPGAVVASFGLATFAPCVRARLHSLATTTSTSRRRRLARMFVRAARNELAAAALAQLTDARPFAIRSSLGALTPARLVVVGSFPEKHNTANCQSTRSSVIIIIITINLNLKL